MNPSELVTLYKLGNDASKLWNQIWHGGKDCLGELKIQDSSGCLWEIKVRYTGYRGRYLKLQSKSNDKRKIRASADNYKIGEYISITPTEWEVFLLLVKDSKDKEIYTCAKNILDRLIK
jgi:hypothetical protein